MATQVVVKGLDDFRRDLRRVDPRLAKSLQVANKKIATKAVSKVKPAASALSSPGSHRIAGGITPRATQRSAKIAFSQAARSKPLLASILGANWHPVFGRLVKADSMSRRLWKPHLGTDWTPSDLYGVGPVFRNLADTFVLEEYADAIEKALSEAFPEG